MGGKDQEARHDLRFHSPVKMPSSAFVNIVDDDSDVLESLGDLLRSMDYQVVLYGSASDFLKVELSDAPACVVLDVRLQGRAQAQNAPACNELDRHDSKPLA